MALVHKEQKVLGEVVEQRHGRRPLGPRGNDARIVLDARAVAQLAHHLDVVPRPLVDALRLHRLSVVGEELLPHLQLALDLLDGALHLVLRRHIVRRGIDGDVLERARHLTVDGVEFADPVDLVAEELDAHGLVAVVRRVELHRVAAHAEAVALKGDVVALVANFDEPL